MKKPMKIVGVLLLVLAVALLVAFFVVRAAFPPEKIRTMVAEQLTKTLQREASVGGASFSLWPLGVKIEDIRVANNGGAGFSKDPLLNLPKAVVSIDLSQLLRLHVTIDEIALEGLSLNYEVMPDGRTSIDGLGGPSDTTQKDTSKLDLSTIELPGTLNLKEFRIEDARVVFNDRGAKRKIILGDIDQSVDLDLDRTLENVKTTGELLVQEISVEDAASGLRKGNVHISLRHDVSANLRQQHVVVNTVQVGVQSILVTLQGSVDRFMEDIMLVDLKLASNEMKLGELLKEVPTGINPEIAKVKAAGSASFALAVKGPIVSGELPALDGKISLKDIALSHSDLPAGITALNGLIAFDANHVLVKPFGLQLAGQPVNVVVEAEQLLAPKPLLKQLLVDAYLDLGALFALAEKLAPIPAGTSLQGVLTAKVQASGALDPAHPEGLNVAGNAELKNVVAKVAELPDAVSLNGVLAFSNTGIATTQAAKIGPSDVKLDVAVRDYLAFVMPRLALGKRMSVDVGVTSSNLELDRLMVPMGEEKAEEESLPMEQWPELPDVALNVKVNLAHTVFRHLTLSDFRMGVGMAGQKVDMDMGGRLYNGTFASRVGVDLADRKSAAVKLGMQVKNVEANDFISNGNDNVTGETELAKQLRALDNTVYGKLSLDMDVITRGLPQTFLDNLSGPIQVSVTDGKLMGSKVGGSIAESVTGFEIAGRKVLKDVVKVDLKNMAFKDLHAGLEAKDGKMLVKDFRMNAGGLGMLAVNGGVGFDGSLDLGVQNTFTAEMSKKLEGLTGGAQKAVASLAGKTLGGLGSSVAAGVSSVSLYPKDEAGNALFFLGLGGTLGSPKAQIDKPRMASALAASNKNVAASPAADLKASLNAKLGDAKAQAKAALDAKKAELEAQAKAKQAELEAQAKAKQAELQAEADAKKAELEAKAKAKTDEAKSKATSKAKDALKGGLKGFGK